MYVIKVLVQLPDGSFARLPCARHKDGGGNQDFEVVTESTEKEAWNWGKVILPDRFSVWERERTHQA